MDTCICYTAAVNPNGIKTLAVNGLSAFPIEGIPVFSNGPKGLSKNPPDFPILCNWVFDDFVLADQPFSKRFLKLRNLCRS